MTLDWRDLDNFDEKNDWPNVTAMSKSNTRYEVYFFKTDWRLKIYKSGVFLVGYQNGFQSQNDAKLAAEEYEERES